MYKKKIPKKEKKYTKKLKKKEPEEIYFNNRFDLVANFDGSYSFSKIGYGFCLIDVKTQEEIYSHSSFFRKPKSCSSVAEYVSLSFLLIYLETNFKNKVILITGDSKMCCDQMNGLGKINKGNYSIFAKFCKELLSFSNNYIEFLWRPRIFNERADELSKIY